MPNGDVKIYERMRAAEVSIQGLTRQYEDLMGALVDLQKEIALLHTEIAGLKNRITALTTILLVLLGLLVTFFPVLKNIPLKSVLGG